MKDTKIPGIDDGIEAFDAYNKTAMNTFFGSLPSCPVCMKQFQAGFSSLFFFSFFALVFVFVFVFVFFF